jgi:alanyl-tRNA synthetase
MDSTQIRSLFLNYFETKGHEKIQSSSLVPNNDPTLLFANAGMNQFKDNFTGMANPKNKRAVTIQKCVRAGGKHNDLENVGFTARHHTFFEMLGNFSFGDYFKKEAISFAWDFLTNTLKISKDKLYITVHNSDQEAADIWHNEQGIPRERIFFRDDKDNFWEMGETGPCGPSSEIFYDHGEQYSDGSDTSKCILDDESRYVEIWNLVFMQYEKYAEGTQIKKRNLPKPSVDTGAGLERLAAVVEGVYWNYDTKLFKSLIDDIRALVGPEKIKTDYDKRILNIIADHMRSSTMLITDGVIPGNEGRGYVLRSIIRRAVRYLHKLGVQELTLFRLVTSVFKELGKEFPQNMTNSSLAQNYLKLEEENFRKTLEKGTLFLEEEIRLLTSKGKRALSGKVAFKLHDTFGFPFDLTVSILKENNLTVNEDEFNLCMKEQKERSKKTSNFSGALEDTSAFYKVKEEHGSTKFLGYDSLEAQAQLLAQIDTNDNSYLIFNQSPFYPESGGQRGDQGTIKLPDGQEVEVTDTQNPIEGLSVHITNTKLPHEIKLQSKCTLKVDKSLRWQTTKNHSATHLLQAALIKVLGDHVKQSGSQVTDDKLRFDFTHTSALSFDQLEEVEKIVNTQIQNSLDVNAEVMNIEKARKQGAMALFGEKYGEEVRVLKMGDFSTELCGGTHIKNTSDIGLFVITLETSLSSGIRRIEATTSINAYKYLNQRSKILKNLERNLGVNSLQITEKIESIQSDEKESRKQINELKSQIQSFKSKSLFDKKITISNDINLVASFDNTIDAKELRSVSDNFIDKNKTDILLLGSFNEGKLSYLLRTHKSNSNINCSNTLKEAQKEFGGRGGGKPDMAQGSCEGNVSDKLTQKILNTLKE